LIGVPVVWAVLLLFHPTGDGDDFYPVIEDQVTAWIVVHIGTLLFVPLLALVVYVLLRDVDGLAARVSRLALVPFVLFYATWEALVGIGMGLLANEAKAQSAAEQAASVQVIEGFGDSGLLKVFEFIGTGSLIVALIAAGVALHRYADAPLAVPILFAVAALPTAWHVTPFGQFGLALFTVGVLLVLRARPARAPASAAAAPTAHAAPA
jgi:hypothetical protein